MNLKILYPVIDGEITGGNIICLRIIEASLKRAHEVVVNSPTEGKFTHLLREKGIKVYGIDTRRTFRLDSAIKLAYIIRKEGISLIHSHTPLGGTVLSRLAGWIAGVPVITHAHVDDFMNRNPLIRLCQFLLNWVTSRLFCAKIIAVSRYVKSQIVKQGISANKIVVVCNGVSFDDADNQSNTIKIRKEFDLSQHQSVIGMVGRLCKDKGQHILIKSAKKVIEKYPDTVFMIVGEDLVKQGKYRQDLKNQALRLGLKQQIIFTGYRSDIMDLMHLFEIFVFPSSYGEGFPLSILESMAAEKPVIATSVGGIPEIVIDKETATLIPPQDPDKLAEAIIYHLKNQDISKKMGEEGYKRLKQYFSLSQMLERIFGIYKEVLN